MPKITFKIEDGEVSADANGFKGQACVKETEKLMAGLNAKLKERRLKAAYAEKVGQVDKITVSE